MRPSCFDLSQGFRECAFIKVSNSQRSTFDSYSDRSRPPKAASGGKNQRNLTLDSEVHFELPFKRIWL
jgi:hypothetical protein